MAPSKPPRVSKRRRARRIAVEALYQWDVGGLDPAEAESAYIPARVGDDRIRRESAELVRGVVERSGEIDARLRDVMEHWSSERLAAIDRAILRLGAYEVLFRDDTPAAAAINEAVELAKLLSTAESGGFVNGVLDRIRMERDARTEP